jgi:hypothetical protein
VSAKSGKDKSTKKTKGQEKLTKEKRGRDKFAKELSKKEGKKPQILKQKRI